MIITRTTGGQTQLTNHLTVVMASASHHSSRRGAFKGRRTAAAASSENHYLPTLLLTATFVLSLLQISFVPTEAFGPRSASITSISPGGTVSAAGHNTALSIGTVRVSTALFSTPPRRSQPRRNLKKRPRRRDKRGRLIQASDTEDQKRRRQQEEEQTEWRPLAKARAVEAGEDYWIDEAELRKVQERERALKNRQQSVGEMPMEKLRTEVVAPYKQNWIGWFSVGIVMIATIVTQFPELLNSPIIPIPDL